MTEVPPAEELSNLSLDKCNFSTHEFALSIPEELIALPDLNLHSNGVVGQITFLKNCVMIWIGWGRLELEGNNSSMTSCGTPAMGPMCVSMPRTNYQGMGSNESAISQLIGGLNEEEVILGNHMAARLSKKIGRPVFVSSSLGDMGSLGSTTTSMDGDGLAGNSFGDVGSLAVHAAALAEKEVGRILLEKSSKDA